MILKLAMSSQALHPGQLLKTSRQDGHALSAELLLMILRNMIRIALQVYA